MLSDEIIGENTKGSSMMYYNDISKITNPEEEEFVYKRRRLPQIPSNSKDIILNQLMKSKDSSFN